MWRHRNARRTVGADVAFAMLFLKQIFYILLKEWFRGLWMSFNHNKGGITHDTVSLPPYGYLMKV